MKQHEISVKTLIGDALHYSNQKDELQYVIYGNVYSYKHFIIPIQF